MVVGECDVWRWIIGHDSIGLLPVLAAAAHESLIAMATKIESRKSCIMRARTIPPSVCFTHRRLFFETHANKSYSGSVRPHSSSSRSCGSRDPLLPVIAADFELTVGTAGIIVTAFALPYGICQIVLGPLGDRFGKLSVIVISLGASSLFTTGCAAANSIEALAALRFMAGIATAAVVPLSMAFIADHFAYEVRQPVIARYLSGLILGQIAGGSLGGIMAAAFGWRVIFVVFGILAGAMTYFVWRYSNHHRETLRPAPLRGRHLFSAIYRALAPTRAAPRCHYGKYRRLFFLRRRRVYRCLFA